MDGRFGEPKGRQTSEGQDVFPSKKFNESKGKEDGTLGLQIS